MLTEKSKEVRDQIEKLDAEIGDLLLQVENNAEEKVAAQKQLNEIWLKVEQISGAGKLKRQGIIWVTIGLILAILEVMLLTETLITGYSDFDFVDLILIGVPLILGLSKLKKASKAKNVGDVDALEEELRKLDAQMKEFEALEAKLENARAERKALVAYNGRDWDIASFYATPANVAAMEADFVDLLVLLKMNEADTDYIVDCWLGKNAMRDLTAAIQNDQSVKSSFDRGMKEMKTAGSWKLEVAQIVIAVIYINLLNEGLSGGAGSGATFAELMEKSDVRKPSSKEEQALWDLAGEVADNVAFRLAYRLKQCNNG